MISDEMLVHGASCVLMEIGIHRLTFVYRGDVTSRPLMFLQWTSRPDIVSLLMNIQVSDG